MNIHWLLGRVKYAKITKRKPKNVQDLADLTCFVFSEKCAVEMLKTNNYTEQLS